MGYPPSQQEKDFNYWRFEPIRALNVSARGLRSARFVNTSGNYVLFADTKAGYGSGQTTLCYDFPATYDIKTGYDLAVNYDVYCFDLHTSDIVPNHNKMGYTTAVLVRLVEQKEFGSILLSSVLAAPEHTFSDPVKNIKVEVVSISPDAAILKVTI